MKEYEKGINWELLSNISNCYTGENINVCLEMDSMTIKTGDESQSITIENEVFELIMAKYIERKKRLKELNK